MRHWICGVVLAAAVLGGCVAVDQVGRRSAAPGAAWVVARGEPQALLARLPEGGGVRVIDAWAGGRIVLLHAPALGAIALPRDATWLVWRAPPAALSLAPCG